MDEFQRGVRAYHDSEFEQAINYFIKALGYNNNNHLARLFLGDSYRKAGYEKNAIFAWNTLLSLGYEDKSLKTKISYLYSKIGMLSDININKTYLIRDDINGYSDDKNPPLFLKPSQICVDKNNHYFISAFSSGYVAELNSNLSVVKNHFPLTKKLKKPFGIAVDNDGYLYVSDFEADEVIVMDRIGQVKKTIGFKGIGEGGLLGPEYLIFDDDDNLYVADSGNHRINKYKKNGDILFSFGNKDNSDGKLKQPAGIFYSDNKIYVCDKEAGKINIYDKSGNFINSFGEDKLNSPYSLLKDNYGRFLILCEKNLWAYEEENDLWYIIDAPGNRLKKGISMAIDKDDNILITDFNTSRLIVLAKERTRYTNLNVNIERIFTRKFPDVYINLTVENEDFSIPQGINETNITIFENGKQVSLVSTSNTKQRDINTDIIVVYDKNQNMLKYQKDFRIIMDEWIKNKNQDTKFSFVSIKEEEGVLENDFNSTRLQMLDSIDDKNMYLYTDKGAGIKFGIYHFLNRFSKKALILVTNSDETGNDFERFKLENCVALARNNNIPVYIVSFADGGMTETYQYIAKKTGGSYYRVYKQSDLRDLINKIEESKGREIVVSYKSEALSRFGEEPIVVSLEVKYSGMNGVTKSVYYPANKEYFNKQ